MRDDMDGVRRRGRIASRCVEERFSWADSADGLHGGAWTSSRTDGEDSGEKEKKWTEIFGRVYSAKANKHG